MAHSFLCVELLENTENANTGMLAFLGTGGFRVLSLCAALSSCLVTLVHGVLFQMSCPYELLIIFPNLHDIPCIL